MPLQGSLKSLKIIKKRGLETILPNSIKHKCENSIPADLKNRGLAWERSQKPLNPEVQKQSPKYHQKASQNHPKIDKKATLGASWNSISKTCPKSAKTEPNKPPKRRPKSSKNHQKVTLGSHWASSGRLWLQKGAQEGVPPLKKHKISTKNDRKTVLGREHCS